MTLLLANASKMLPLANESQTLPLANVSTLLADMIQLDPKSATRNFSSMRSFAEWPRARDVGRSQWTDMQPA